MIFIIPKISNIDTDVARNRYDETH